VTWLVAAGAAFASSLTLRLLGRKMAAWYISMGVPAFLLIGVYNKIVKVKGSERTESRYDAAFR
jgi:hypothetical protein